MKQLKSSIVRCVAIAVALFAPVFAGVTLGAAVLHVGSGQTYADIASAIKDANDDDVIEIDAGTYNLTATLSVTKNITLRGAGIGKTIIHGGWSGNVAAGQPGVRCLSVNAADARVENLTITGGYGTGTSDGTQGMGVYIGANGGTVSNCVIAGNCKWSRRIGCAGVYLNSTAAVLTHCYVTNNISSYSGNVDATTDLVFGAGVMAVAGRVSSCTISDNTGGCKQSRGGGLYLGTANASADHCLISDNKLTFTGGSENMKGAGVFMLDGTLDNCLVVNNTATSTKAATVLGGGLHQEGGTVVNCTFADNTAYAGGGVHVTGGSFVNNIVCRNTANAGQTEPDYLFAAEATGSNLCLPAYAAGAAVATQFANSVFTKSGEVPFLADYSIDPGSVCYDKGLDDVTTSVTDFFGATRVQGTHIDIGASEATPVSGLVVSFEVGADVACSTEPVTLTGSAYGPGVTEENTTYVWTDDRGVELGRGKVVDVYFEPGVRSVTLTVTSGEQTKALTKPDCVAVADGNIYVATDGTQTPPYNTPGIGFTNLEDAVAYAMDGMAIHVGEGTFVVKQTITVDRRVRIVGAGPEKTVLDGGYRDNNNAGCRRIFVLGNAGACVSSLVVSNAVGGSQYGAGVYIGSAGGTVTNCWVCHNTIGGGNTGYGAGIHMASDYGLITHSRIFANGLPNASAHDGAGVYMTGGVLKDSLIVGNTSSATGSGIKGGGVSAAGGWIVNCTIADNFAYNAGGIALTGAAKAINCLVYGNAAHSSVDIPDFNISASNAFANCCFPAYAADTDLAKASPGMVFVSVAPFDDTYRLKPGSPCEDAGDDGACADLLDLFGAIRTQGDRIDIGCAESTPAAEMLVDFAIAPSVAVGATMVTFTGFASGGGAKPAECTYEWTVNGEKSTGRIVRLPLGVDRYDVTLKVTSQKGDVKSKTVAQALTIYPTEVRMEKTATPAWPWTEASNAFTNLAEALAACIDGMTIRVGEGAYPVRECIVVSKAISVIGAGQDRTTFYRDIPDRMRVFLLDNAYAVLSDLAVTNGSVSGADQGGAIAFSQANGGTVDRCQIAGCSGNSAVSVFGSKALLKRSVIRDNDCTGVKIWDGGVCEDCLVTGNRAEYGAGVLMTEHSQGRGTLRNCTVIYNQATSTKGEYSGAGIYAVGVTATRNVINCLAYGNTLASEVENPEPGYPDVQGCPLAFFHNCWTTSDLGTNGFNCVVGTDPKVRRNGKIRVTSGCFRAGLYQSWMEGATDLFGNPRTDAKAQAKGEPCVDIGCHQAMPAGLTLLVR